MITHIQNIWLKIKNTESTDRRKTSFPKEIVENADLHKTALSKIIITQEKCVNYDFVAPLIVALILVNVAMFNRLNGLLFTMLSLTGCLMN